jgi:hypothetical protein
MATVAGPGRGPVLIAVPALALVPPHNNIHGIVIARTLPAQA